MDNEQHFEQFSTLEPSVRGLWAKSGECGGHGLLAHMLDVAAVAEVLLHHEPDSSRAWIAQSLGLAFDDVVRDVAALVGLHDFGKAIPGFQRKWDEGRNRDGVAGLPFPRDLGTTDHSLASAVLLLEELASSEIPRSWLRHVLQAISAHHGYNFKTYELSGANLGSGRHKPDDPWALARRSLLAAYLRASGPRIQPQVDDVSLAAVEWLAGLTTVADWIASNPEWFPLGERADRLQEHFAEGKALARKALDAIGWPPYRNLLEIVATTDDLIRKMLPDSSACAARPLQLEGDKLLAEADGPAFLLVEAPMGEGKTELAFLAHLRLQVANRHRGLYFALPTQATGDAIFARTLHFLHNFSTGMPLDLQLVHGAAAANETVAHLRHVYGERRGNAASVQSSAWFSQRRRPLISPYGVGTVDQALLTVLNVKHHFVRVWGLANRVVVLDEVHAYDTYTTGLIGSMLRWLKALGCSVVLMSATLPAKVRRELFAAWDIRKDQLPELPYPRLLLASRAGVAGVGFAARPMPDVHLHSIAEEVESLANCAIDCLQAGGCGAVIVNTVDRAQKLYTLLAGRLGDGAELLLFHARFPAKERSQCAERVLRMFGAPERAGERPRKALLIATQVAEQSLDVDFDFLITDLAPVDLVLQRAGRLHRHDRLRPQRHEQARLYVAGLQPERLPQTKTTAWKYVYDPYILLRSWAWLSRESVLHLPQDIDRLVQLVYDPDALPEGLTEEMTRRIDVTAFGAHLARRNDERLKAVHAAIDVRQEPQNAYLQKPKGHEEGDELGILNRTRLGDEALAVVPVHQVAGGWSEMPDGPPFDPDTMLEDARAKLLFARQLKVSRQPLRGHLAAICTPRAFAEHPLLRHLKPLVLTGGRVIVDSLLVRLDPVLGLVYEKMGRDSATSAESNENV